MEIRNIDNLAAAVTLRAVRDYFATTPKRQKAILKDLRSEWMSFLTNGMSVVVAERLERNPKEIQVRLHKTKEG